MRSHEPPQNQQDKTILLKVGAAFAKGYRQIKLCFTEGGTMPRGDKGAYTDKQKRKAEHIEEGYEKRGVSKKEAEKRAWATVNK